MPISSVSGASLAQDIPTPVDLRYIEKAAQIKIVGPSNEDHRSFVYIQFRAPEDADSFVKAHGNQFPGLICEINVSPNVAIYERNGRKSADQIQQMLEQMFGKKNIEGKYCY